MYAVRSLKVITSFNCEEEKTEGWEVRKRVSRGVV